MKKIRIRSHETADILASLAAEQALCDSGGRKASRAAWKTGALLTVGVVGAVSAANALIFARAPKMGNRLGGAFGRYPTRYGDLAYTVTGAGKPPLLLLHGFGAGNSAFEWHESIDVLAQSYSVYTLDFLGWGLSDKYRHAHTAADYIEMVSNFMEDVVAEACILVASNGAAPIAIEAAARAPHNVAGLVLICPPFGDASEGQKLSQKWLQKVLWLPLSGTSLYNFITSRAQIEQFARRHLYFDKARVDEALVNRYHATAHQSAAQFGVFAFLSGALDVDARQSWSRLQMPSLLVWGRNAQINPLETAPEWLALKPDADLAVIDNAMLLPHAEHPQRFAQTLQRWIGALQEKSSPIGASV
ncbi:MAG: hypothetical protein JWN98_1170 [Abditibacteriota bacterium]|nr:hypothetical protein [Abditibacteriota bacterium]